MRSPRFSPPPVRSVPRLSIAPPGTYSSLQFSQREYQGEKLHTFLGPIRSGRSRTGLRCYHGQFNELEDLREESEEQNKKSMLPGCLCLWFESPGMFV